MYTLFIKEHIRVAFHKRDVGYEEACKFLTSHPYGVVGDSAGNHYYTKEELENAKSLRPVPTFEFDSEHSGDGEISESSNIELFGSFGSKTE